MIDSKILTKIIKDSKTMSRQDLINKYKKQNIEIEYHLDNLEFITITNINDKTDKSNVELKEINKYFNDIDRLVNNMNNEEFEKLLVEAGIENCPYYEG